ncbi:hypothetical protein, partial [Staphylococcus devriesei]
MKFLFTTNIGIILTIILVLAFIINIGLAFTIIFLERNRRSATST